MSELIANMYCNSCAKQEAITQNDKLTSDWGLCSSCHNVMCSSCLKRTKNICASCKRDNRKYKISYSPY